MTGTAPSGTTEESEERESLSFDEGLEILDSLFDELHKHEERVSVLQHEIGTTLWRMDPQSEEDWQRVAKRYGKSASTLKIWLRTAARLREPLNGLPFSVMAELARIPDKKGREEILATRPVEDWTLETMRSAVRDYLYKTAGDGKKNPLGPQARGGCRVHLDEDHVLNVKAQITGNMVTVELVSSIPLGDGEITRRGDGHLNRVEFTW